MNRWIRYDDGLRRYFKLPAQRQNNDDGLDRVKVILVIHGANTSYSRLTMMYYRRAQPTTRGLENGYEESEEDLEESSGEEGCEEDRSEEDDG